LLLQNNLKMIPTYDIQDFPSFQAIEGQFMLERFEDLKRPPNLQWPHKHSFFEILWLTSGLSTNVIDYHQVTIEPNMLFFISPGQLHLMSKAEDVRGYSITFTEEFLLLNTNNKDMLLELSFLDNSYSGPSLKLNEAAISELQNVIALMQGEVELKQKSPAIIGHLLFVLLNKIQRVINTQHPESADLASTIKFKRFKKLVDDNFKLQSGLPFYADKLAMGPHRLNQICKQVINKTAGEVIRERILLEAKRLLVHSDQSIGQIGDELGFQDFSYFSRQFKRQEQLTPAAYRKSMSEKYQNL
jgi:AraC family transcriptional activator of pobA